MTQNQQKKPQKGGGVPIRVVFGVLLLLFSSHYSRVYAKEGGCFTAVQRCEAFQSLRKKTNPGKVRLQANAQYKVLEKSKKMKAYRIQIEGLDQPARWVKRNCGNWAKSCRAAGAGGSELTLKTFPQKKPVRKKYEKPPQYLLALTWQPTFCEAKTRKKECRSQTRNRYDAQHWSLHGLWPQPRNNTYCGVSEVDKGIDRNKRWHLLEPPQLSAKTARELAFVMPGMASNLHRHEWLKHGTCYGKNADRYYADSVYLTQAINESAVGALFRRNLGNKVSLKEIRAHFDQAFGAGAGKKVDLRCDRKGRISELWVNLTGEISAQTPVKSLLQNAVNAPSTCLFGRVDKANR